MNFLELVSAAYEECGVSGSPPTDVTSATGEARRIVRWTQESWRQVQLQHLNWKWMLGTATLPTVASTQRYAVAATTAVRWRVWVPYSARIFKTSVTDETPLTFVAYERFLQESIIGNSATGRPSRYTIGVNGELIFSPTPDGVYTVTLDYRKGIQTLTLNADIPEMPETFHYAIVYRTMMKYARFESAPEIFADAQEDYNAEMQRLGVEQLEEVEWHTESLA